MADVIYTGKGLAPDIPSEGGKAMGRLSDFIVKAEEIKYNAFKETQDWFVKSQDIDPVMFLTTANQVAQDKLLKTYNEESSAILKASNNNLSTEDRAKIIAGKNVLISEQQKMQSDMEQAILEKGIIDKDQGVNYDPVEWYQEKWQPYIESGKYNKTPLRLRARPVEDFIKTKITGAGAYEEPDPDNPWRLRVMGASRKDVAPRIADVIFSNEAVKRHAIEEWNTRTPEEKEMFFDQNNDSIITEEERRSGDVLTKSLDNPIIKAYVDKHWGNLVDTKFVNKPKPPSAGATFNWNIGIGGGNNRNGQYDDQGFANFNKLKVNSWLDLGRDAPSAKDRQIQDYVDTETGERKYFGSAAEIKIVGYSPDKDMIIVKVTKTSENRELREGNYIGLPGDKYKDWLESKPFGLHRESLLKQYGQPATPATSGVDWKKTEPAKGNKYLRSVLGAP